MKNALLVLLVALMFGCTDDNTVQPPLVTDPFADCGNGEPISPADSFYSLWPHPRYYIHELKISSKNGWWAARYDLLNSAKGKEESGVFVYDSDNDLPIGRYDASWGHSWSPDGSQLVLINGNDIYVFSAITFRLKKITEGGLYQSAVWATNGKYLFARKIRYTGVEDTLHGIVRMLPDGGQKTNLTSYFLDPKVLNETHLITIIKDTLFIYDVVTHARVKIYKPEMDNSHSPKLYDISADGKYVVFETTQDGSQLDPWENGIWLMDTATWTARKIRGAQWWGNGYYPTWASASTFYASVFCRKDSASMVWEFDLNGNPIRQVTTKEMNVWKE